MKTCSLFVFLAIFHFSSSAQNAISFDSLQFKYSLLTNDAVYFNSDKLIKSDYQGNILWSKTGSFSNSPFKVEGSAIYLYKNNLLTKLDTTGNLLWSIEFSQLVCASVSAANSIADVVLNGDRIYVLINQQPLSINLNLPSLITLDTSSTVINSWCGNNYEFYTFAKGVKSPSGGAWLSLHDGGNIHTGISMKVDVNGDVVPFSTYNIFQNGQFNFVEFALLSSDSSHCYFVNSFSSGSRAYPYIVFESNAGNILSYKGYGSASITWGIDFLAATIDSNDNLYILTSEGILLKTNSIGDIQIGKQWSASALQSLQLSFLFNSGQVSMIRRQDSLYIATTIDGKPSIIAFDSLLNATCYAPDLSIQLPDNLPLSYGDMYTLSVSQVNYTTSTPAFQNLNISQPEGVSVCRITEVEKTSQLERLKLYPNPAADDLIIDADGKAIEFFLYNSTGQKMDVSFDVINEKTKLKTSSLNNGIYFIVVKIDDDLVKEIILIQR